MTTSLADLHDDILARCNRPPAFPVELFEITDYSHHALWRLAYREAVSRQDKIVGVEIVLLNNAKDLDSTLSIFDLHARITIAFVRGDCFRFYLDSSKIDANGIPLEIINLMGDGNILKIVEHLPTAELWFKQIGVTSLHNLVCSRRCIKLLLVVCRQFLPDLYHRPLRHVYRTMNMYSRNRVKLTSDQYNKVEASLIALDLFIYLVTQVHLDSSQDPSNNKYTGRKRMHTFDKMIRTVKSKRLNTPLEFVRGNLVVLGARSSSAKVQPQDYSLFQNHVPLLLVSGENRICRHDILPNYLDLLGNSVVGSLDYNFLMQLYYSGAYSFILEEDPSYGMDDPNGFEGHQFVVSILYVPSELYDGSEINQKGRTLMMDENLGFKGLSLASNLREQRKLVARKANVSNKSSGMLTRALGLCSSASAVSVDDNEYINDPSTTNLPESNRKRIGGFASPYMLDSNRATTPLPEESYPCIFDEIKKRITNESTEVVEVTKNSSPINNYDPLSSASNGSSKSKAKMVPSIYKCFLCVHCCLCCVDKFNALQCLMIKSLLRINFEFDRIDLNLLKRQIIKFTKDIEHSNNGGNWSSESLPVNEDVLRILRNQPFALVKLEQFCRCVLHYYLQCHHKKHCDLNYKPTECLVKHNEKLAKRIVNLNPEDRSDMANLL